MKSLKGTSFVLAVVAVGVLAVGTPAFSAMDAERGTTLSVVDDDSAYVTLDYDETVVVDRGGETTLLSMTNQFRGELQTVEAEVVDDGGLGVSVGTTPDGLDRSETGTITLDATDARAGTAEVELEIEVEGDGESSTLRRTITVTVEGASECEITEEDIHPTHWGPYEGYIVVGYHDTVDCIDVSTDRTLKIVVLGTVEGDTSVHLEDGAGLSLLVGFHGMIGGDVPVTYEDDRSWFCLIAFGTIGGDVSFQPAAGAGTDGWATAGTSASADADTAVTPSGASVEVYGEPVLDEAIPIPAGEDGRTASDSTVGTDADDSLSTATSDRDVDCESLEAIDLPDVEFECDG